MGTGSGSRDGGYGWVIVFAFFLVEVLVDGIRFSFGVYFVEFLEEFKRGKGDTAWVGSLMVSTYNLAGPIFALIVNKVGYRVASFIGSIITTVGFLLSYFASDVYHLYPTFGVLQGFGFGLMYLAGTVAVGRYFYKKRARAMGTALCGAGIGMFVFIPLVQYIKDTYTWRGGMFILAGIALNGCVLSALYRPIDYVADDEEFEVNSDIQDNEIDIHSIHEVKGLHSNGIVLSSLDDVNDNISIRSKHSRMTNGHCDNHSQNGSLFLSALKIDKVDHETENGTTHVTVPLMNGSSCFEKENAALNGHVFRSGSPQPRSFAEMRREQLMSFSPKSAMGSQRSLRSVNLSVVSQSIFGSNASFDYMFGKRTRNKHLMNSKTHIPQTTSAHGRTEVLTSQETLDKFNISIIETVFPKRLVKNINFQLMMLSCIFAGVPAFIPYSMLPDFAQTAGATAAESAWTLSAIGIGGTFSRIAGGWLADQPCVHTLTLLSVCFLGCGVSTIITAFITSYYVIMIYSVCYGIFFGAVYIVQPIVLLDYLGDEYIAEIMGVTMCVYGLSGFIGSPLAGWMFDATGSYTVSFVAAGSLFVISGLVNSCVLCTKPSRESRRAQTDI